MAEENKILFTAEFNSKQLDKQFKEFGKRFSAAIKDSFNNLQIKGIKDFKLPVTITAQSVNAAIQDVSTKKLRSLSLPVTITAAAVNAAIADINKGITATIPASIAKAKTEGTKTATAIGSTVNRNETVPQLDDDSIKKARASLAAYREELRKNGLTADEITKATRKFETALANLEARLQRIKDLKSVFAQTNPGETFVLTDKQLLGLQKGRVALDSLVGGLTRTSVAQTKLSAETERVSNFMDSFGFKVGILGFGMGILGGTLQRLTQNMVQFYTASAKAVEPLQRVQNLLNQDPGLSATQRESVLTEINRLADLPGGNLDAVVKSFRSLASLKLGDEKVLELIEGITKATALSGTGAEGAARLIEQFRQFIQSGVLTERDVRTISEQGGVRVTDALQQAFGTTNAGALQEIGPQKVLDAIIKGLGELQTPLATSTDRINRLENSFNRIRVSILKLIDPGMEQLLDILKSVEEVVADLTERFDGLTADQKKGIGNLIVAIPILTGALATLLTTLAAVGIGLATLKHALDGLAIVKTALAPVLAVLSKVGQVIRVLFTGTGVESSLVFAGSLTKIGNALSKVLAVVTKFATALSVVGAIIAVVFAYITDSGLTRGIIDGAVSRLSTAFGKLFAQLQKFISSEAGQVLLLFLEEAINVLGTVANVITDVLASALGAVLDVITTIVTVMSSFIELLNSPSIENLNRFASTVYNALRSPFDNLGKILASSFIDAIADLADNRLTSFLFGGLPGMPNTNVAEGLRGVARDIRTGVAKKTGDNIGKVEEALGKLNNEADSTDDSLNILSKGLRDLRDTFDSLSDKIAQSIADLRSQQISFQRDRQLTRLDRDTERQLQADPVNFNVGAAVSRRTSIAQTSQAALDANALNSIAIQSDKFLRDPLAGETSGTILTLISAFKQLKALSDGGATSVEVYKVRLQELATAAKNIQTAIDDPSSALRAVITNEEQEKKFKDFAKDALDFAIQYQDTVSKAESANAQILQDAQVQTEELQEKQNELTLQLLAEERQRGINLELQVLQNQLALEEIELQRLIEEDLSGQETQEKVILGIKLNIVAKEKELADAGRIYANKLAETQAINEAALKTEQQKAEAARLTAARIREQARAANELFRSSIQQLAEMQRQQADKAFAPLPFRTPSTAGFLPGTDSISNAAEDLAQTEGIVVEDIDNQFTKLINSADAQFIKPLTSKFRETIDSIFSGTNSFESNFNTLFDGIVKKYEEVQREIVATETSIRNTPKEQSAGLTDILQQLQLRAGKYSEVLELLNKLDSERNVILENTLKINLSRLNQERVNLEFMQESLELSRQRTELESRQRQDQASKGILDFEGILRGIAKERKEADADEIRTLHQKYALLRNELDVREAILLTEAQKAGKSKEDLDALRALFAERRRLLGEQEVLETTTTESENKKNPVLQQLQDINQAFKEQFGVALQARDALLEYFDTLASGQGVIGAFTKLMMGGGSALETFTEFGKFAVAAFASAFTQAFTQMLTEGESFTAGFGKFLGQLLIMLGQALLQMGIAAAAAGLIRFLFGDVTGPVLGAKAAAFAAVAGAGLIALGTAIGGGSSSKAASTNTGNKTSTATGSQGEDFDANRDPRLIYQKALMAQIEIDIKTDDTQVVNTVIKHVNQNGRLARLIGNRKLQFGY